jgi:hypothetical protein
MSHYHGAPGWAVFLFDVGLLIIFVGVIILMVLA